MRNEEENRQIQQLIPTGAVTYMGLFKDAFVWSDNSMSSFRNWESSQPDGSGDCVVHSRQSRLWDDQECSDARPFFCYDSECFSKFDVLWLLKQLIVSKISSLGYANVRGTCHFMN